jgi:hypothetical protein
VRGVVVHAATNTLVNASNPIQPGEDLYLYATGLGPVDNAPATGSATQSTPLAHTLALPSITIVGQSCLVRFAGLAPGLAGLPGEPWSRSGARASRTLATVPVRPPARESVRALIHWAV